MLGLIDAIVLGVVQGVTEFLPISSSGHLILVRDAFSLAATDALAVDAVFHFATALAVLIYFRRDIILLIRGLWWWGMRKVSYGTDQAYALGIVLATVPAVAAGLVLEETMATLFRNAHLVAGSLIIGSIIMLVGEWRHRVRERRALTPLAQPPTLWHALTIGLFQTLALIPGMSRSGMALAGGLLIDLSREQAARFAFLLAVPLLLGAGAKKLIDISTGNADVIIGTPVFLGAACAFISGLIAIHYLLRFVRTHTLGIFIGYRLALAGAVFLVL